MLGNKKNVFGYGWLFILFSLALLCFSGFVFAANYGDINGQSYGAFRTDVNAQRICLLSDSCRTTWPTGGGGSGVDSNKLFVSGTDTVAGFLFNKLVSGKGILLRDMNIGGNEFVQLDVNEAVCTVTVTTNGDFTDIPSAVDSLKTSGGRVCIGPGTFQLARSIDINGANIEIVGQGLATNIRTNPLTIPIAIKVGDNTQHSNIRIKNVQISASSNTGNGTAINMANFAIGHVEDVYINGYNKGIDLNKSNTFYNMIDNVRISVSGYNSIGIRISSGANDNTVMRTRIITDGNGTGIEVSGSHSIGLYEVNVESGSLYGIDLNTGTNGTLISNAYLESNLTNLRIAQGVLSTSVIGGTIETGVTQDIENDGASGYYQTGVNLSFFPSRNQDYNVDLNGTLCLNGDCKSAWPTGGGGGGGSGTTYTSLTPATLEIHNDTNTIGINFDGNFWLRGAPLFPVPDANLSSLSWSKLINYPSGCGAFLAVQTIGSSLTCISVPSKANIDGNVFTDITTLDLNNSLTGYIKKNSTDIPATISDSNVIDNNRFVLNSSLSTLADQNWLVEHTVTGQGTGTSPWNGFPFALSEFPNNIPGAQRWIMDLNNAKQYRIYLDSNVAGVSGSIVWVQFSDNNSTWTDVNTTGGTGGGVLTWTNTGTLLGNWGDVNSSINGQNKYFRIVGSGGDSVRIPILRGLVVQFRGPINNLGQKNVFSDLNVTNTLHGQLMALGNLIGVTCNTTCGSIATNAPWTCVEADNVTGAASTCSDISVAHNCICKN